MNLNFNNLINNIELPDIYQFAEQQIIIPSGPKAGLSFDISMSPLAQHLWPVLFTSDLTKYDTIVVTGPSQCGKTLTTIIASIYIMTILGESVIFSAPNLSILFGKWQQEIFPMFSSSPYLKGYLLDRSNQIAPKLSTTGAYIFTNGSCLRLLSTQSSDRAKSSYTSRNILITEFGGVRPVTTSEEADPLKQLKARCRAYTNVGYRFLLESTGTTTGGLVEQYYQKGTKSEISCECPNCHEWISPWRKDFVLNRDNPKASYAACPKCQFHITEDIRNEIIKQTKAIAQNPNSNIYSMRMSGFLNRFTSIESLAKEELELQSLKEKSPAYESKLKEIQNFVWGEAYEPKIDTVDMSLFDLGPEKMINPKLKRGDIPEWTDKITLGIDVGLKVCFWTMTCWGIKDEKLIAHISDYGIYHTKYESEGNIRAKDDIVIEGLTDLITTLKHHYSIDLILADIGYLFSSLIFWTNSNEKNMRIIGAHGTALAGWRAKTERFPTSSEFKSIRDFEDGSVCYRVLDQMKYVRHTSHNERFYLTEMLRTGDLTLFELADPNGHHDFIKSLDSHFQVVDENGEIKWEKRSGSTDHHLDSAILTLTGYKVLNPTFQFANKERFTKEIENKKQTILTPQSMQLQPVSNRGGVRRGPVIRRR